MFEPSLQLVVVEGGLAGEARPGAGPPDGAEAGAGTPARTGLGRAGDGAWVVHRGGEGSGREGPGEAGGGALELHDSKRTSPAQQHQAEESTRNKLLTSTSSESWSVN